MGLPWLVEDVETVFSLGRLVEDVSVLLAALVEDVSVLLSSRRVSSGISKVAGLTSTADLFDESFVSDASFSAIFEGTKNSAKVVLLFDHVQPWSTIFNPVSKFRRLIQTYIALSKLMYA